MMATKKEGHRPGGRPKGTGKYKEKTSAVRVPDSLLPQLQTLLDQRQKAAKARANLSIPLYTSRIAAGEASMAEDHVDSYVDFNDYLRPDPHTMFCIRAIDDSMKGAGIDMHDVLIVDRALKARSQKIVVVDFNGRPLIRRLVFKAKQIQLMPENTAYESILITEERDFKILGVAIRVIHALP